MSEEAELVWDIDDTESNEDWIKELTRKREAREAAAALTAPTAIVRDATGKLVREQGVIS